MIAGIVGLIIYGLDLVEITGLGLVIIFICLTTGFSAVIHGFQGLRRMKEGGDI